MTIRDMVDQVLEGLDEEWSEPQRELAKQVAGDVLALQAKAAIGGAVDRELAHANASIASLAAAGLETAREAITKSVADFGALLLKRLV